MAIFTWSNQSIQVIDKVSFYEEYSIQIILGRYSNTRIPFEDNMELQIREIVVMDQVEEDRCFIIPLS